MPRDTFVLKIQREMSPEKLGDFQEASARVDIMRAAL